MKQTEFIETARRFLDCTLPAQHWTHEIELHRHLPDMIRRYNLSQGNENTDTSGYHATLTHFFIEAITDFNKGLSKDISTFEACKELLMSPLSDRDFPLKFYSKDKLFSVKARKTWVAPDLVPSPGLEPGWVFPPQGF